MSLTTVFTLLIIFFTSSVNQTEKGKFDKESFYSAISLDQVELIDRQIEILEQSSIVERSAFIGALLMKKAELVKTPKEKLSLFKKGRTDLEKAINENTKNTELRFLRLMIQENAPKILNYNENIGSDSTYLTENFSSLSADVQKAVIEYSKKSKVLDSKIFIH